MGDAYGCGIVAHLSRKELKKLDDEAENEFAKMIAASGVGSGGVLMGDNKPDDGKQNLSICDERDLANADKQQRRHSQHSQLSINAHQHQLNKQQSSHGNAPSFKAMEAIRSHSRNLIFGHNKLPVSVISMPQIAITSPPESTNSAANQDSNV